MQRGRCTVDITALQALAVDTAFLVALIIQKLHIQVAQGAGIGRFALHIDIKGQVAVLAYIECCTQWQGAAALLSVRTGWVIPCG